MKTRIMYLRDARNPQGRGNPIGCVAIGLDLTDKPNKIFYQVSVLHPNDVFDKKMATLKANARLSGQPIEIDATLDEDFSSHEVASIVMSHMQANKNLPTRARQAATNWLNRSEKLSSLGGLDLNKMTNMVDFIKPLFGNQELSNKIKDMLSLLKP